MMFSKEIILVRGFRACTDGACLCKTSLNDENVAVLVSDDAKKPAPTALLF